MNSDIWSWLNGFYETMYKDDPNYESDYEFEEEEEDE